MRLFYLTLILTGLTLFVSGQPNAPENLTAYRGKNGTVHQFLVTGSASGRIWGGSDGIYTDDSHLGTAAVHTGLLRTGETGTVEVTILPGKTSYPKIANNGIVSIEYGSWPGSYKLSRPTK